jgi:hypothetical protein
MAPTPEKEETIWTTKRVIIGGLKSYTRISAQSAIIIRSEVF